MADLTPEQQAALDAARARRAAPQLTAEQQAALDAARTRQQSAPTNADAARQSQLDGLELVATFDDNGRVYRKPDGNLTAVSNAYSTGDQDRIRQIMEGATPTEIVRDSYHDQIIEGAPVGVRVNEVMRGTPFVGSYVDEAMGALDPQRGENLRTATEAMQNRRPGETMALNMGGAVASAIPAAIAAGPAIAANAAKTVGGRALQGLTFGGLTGGVEGLVYGYGEGQGEDRNRNALTQGAIGAGMGGAVGIAAPYATAGIRSLIGRFRTSPAQVISRELGVSNDAAQVIRQAIDSGDDDAALAAIRRAGPAAMLADANPNTQSLLDTAATSPGQAGQVARVAVDQRTQGATQQMVDALDDVLGAPRGEREIISEIRMQSSPARAAAYDAAYAAPIDYAGDGGRQIESLLSRVPDSAVRRANALMQINGEESAQILARVADDGRVVFERMPDVRQLDYITRALNDVAAEADGAGKLGGTTDLGRGIQSLSRNLRQTVRNLVPEYGAALDTAADAISQKNAVESGYDLLRAGTRREDVAQILQGASEAERTAMRQGVRSFIDDVTANVTRTITDGDTASREGIQILRQMSSRANVTKLRMLLGSADADRLLSQIDEATTAFELRSAIATNSRTYARTAMGEAVSEQTAPGWLRTLGRGEPLDATRRLTQAITGETAEAQTIRDRGLYQEIAEALVNTRGAQAERALLMINRAIDGSALNERQAEFIARTAVAGLGATAVPSANRVAMQN